MNKSRKLIIYEAKDGGQLFLNATTYKNNRFTTKNPPYKYGKALSPSVKPEELGKAVRKVLKNCD